MIVIILFKVFAIIVNFIQRDNVVPGVIILVVKPVIEGGLRPSK